MIRNPTSQYLRFRCTRKEDRGETASHHLALLHQHPCLIQTHQTADSICLGGMQACEMLKRNSDNYEDLCNHRTLWQAKTAWHAILPPGKDFSEAFRLLCLNDPPSCPSSSPTSTLHRWSSMRPSWQETAVPPQA
mmetsp:Transcript_4887/g.7858  ORF Transcript_4887/g.7858 Transcript_4887/m.7858 type:complete len:135 (+) Transcript_4887:682-1086(+)